ALSTIESKKIEREEAVILPLMPKGVEHNLPPLPWTHEARDPSSDAERR
ncbi:MAG: hypothetical protein RL268_2753, partial [Pseudomonadota bacterium]